MSEVRKCPACRRRVKRAPYLTIQDRQMRKIYRYHGAPHLACLKVGAAEAERRGPDELVLRFAHSRSCGDPGGRMGCRGGYFAVEQAA